MKLYNIIAFFILISFNLMSQKSEADKKYELYQYAEAIPLYEKYLTNNKDYNARVNLARSYTLTNNIAKAIESYNILIQLPESNSQDVSSLIQMYQINNQLYEAKQIYVQYKSKLTSEKATLIGKSLDNFDLFMSTKDLLTVTNKSSKYNFSVLSIIPFETNYLVTAESNKSSTNKWTGRNSTDIFYTNAQLDNLEPFGANSMCKLDDGIPTISPNQSLIYFTSTHEHAIKENNIQTYKMKIVSIEKVNGIWEAKKDFQYNNEKYNVAHPTMSKDGSILVFSANIPNGKGEWIYIYAKKQLMDGLNPSIFLV